MSTMKYTEEEERNRILERYARPRKYQRFEGVEEESTRWQPDDKLPMGPDTTENIQEVVEDPGYEVTGSQEIDDERQEEQEQPRDQETKMLYTYGRILERMEQTHRKKNSDYGDAAYNGYKKYGDYYFLVQLHNKLSRLESLTVKNTKQQVLDESIDDTLMDMANYAVMYLESRHRND